MRGEVLRGLLDNRYISTAQTRIGSDTRVAVAADKPSGKEGERERGIEN